MNKAAQLTIKEPAKGGHARVTAVNRKKIKALDALLQGGAREQVETFKHLKLALDLERGAGRKLFS